MSKPFISKVNPIPWRLTECWNVTSRPGDQLGLGHRLGAWFIERDTPFMVFRNVDGNIRSELRPVPAPCASDAPASPDEFRRIWSKHFGREIHPFADAIISPVTSISLAAPDAPGQTVMGFILTRNRGDIAHWRIMVTYNVRDVIKTATQDGQLIPQTFCALVCNFEQDGFRLAALFGGEDCTSQF